MFRPLTIFNRRQEPVLGDGDDYIVDPFLRLQREMNRLFHDAFTDVSAPRIFGASDEQRMPMINVRETDSSIEIEAELPGVDEKDLDVQLNNDQLTISAEKKFEKKDEKEGSYHVMERAYGSFARSMTLPFPVDPDEIEATFKDGVLKLTLPKPAETRSEKRRISINR